MRMLIYSALVILAFVITPLAGQAQAAPSLIRDDEIENTLRSWAAPAIRAADLSPSSVRIVLVQSDELNAFVAGGPNIFIYTGLLLRAENPGEVIGVMAHELGHISGGHLVRSKEAIANASFETILGSLAGIGAAILAGDPGAGVAVGAGASSFAARNYLSFSRVQESSADQAGLSFLNRAGMSPAGMVSFMEKLESEEMLPTSQQSEYMRTHPLTRNRIEALEAGLERSPYKDKATDPAWDEEFARMKAKLTGFINPQRVAWDYNDRDQSIPAQYARAIAAYRQNDIETALNGIDRLIKAEPNNPYFAELKGQMLVDFGRVKEGLPYYRKAVDRLPNSGLIRIAYAHALLESGNENDPALLKQVIDQLERAAKDEPRSGSALRMLATAYGRLGDEAAAKLFLAEEAFLKGDRANARAKAESALPGLRDNPRLRIRANDLLAAIDRADDKQ